jgi:hypothetical protein
MRTVKSKRETGFAFERIEHYERLIKLRETSPDAFMLRTSEATRRALSYYETARQRAEVKQ